MSSLTSLFIYYRRLTGLNAIRKGQVMEMLETQVKSRAALDSGYRSLNWQPGPLSGFISGLDIDALLASPEPKKAVRAMPVQPLYYAIKRKGLADCLALLPLLSQDQVIRLFDYDLWHQGQLDPAKAVEWILAFAKLGPKELYQRFAYLDEEYQLGLLYNRFRVYEVEDKFELPDEVQDRVHAMPCGKVYYEILAQTKEEGEAIESIIQSAVENNLRYAYALLDMQVTRPLTSRRPYSSSFVTRDWKKTVL